MIQRDIQKEVIKIYRTPAEGERGTEIAVVRWITDGKASAPQLVNQEVYIDRLDKKRKHGKMKGLKWGDWKFLTEKPERVEEITELLLDIPMRAQHQKATERLPYSDGPEQDPFME